MGKGAVQLALPTLVGIVSIVVSRPVLYGRCGTFYDNLKIGSKRGWVFSTAVLHIHMSPSWVLIRAPKPLLVLSVLKK